MPSLAVNVDHVATLRQARLGREPEPLTAAHMAELAGARAIIAHLREDRRHIQDRDVELMGRCLNTQLNLEMAATAEMRDIALRIKPALVCLVPEKRRELTTEGGLNCVGREQELADYIAPFDEAGIETSLFIDADSAQIEAAREIGAKYVELHTGHYADAATPAERDAQLKKILKGIEEARHAGLVVNLGHGLNYANIYAFAQVSGVNEYSIGHSIMAKAVLVGLDRAVRDMAAIVAGFVD